MPDSSSSSTSSSTSDTPQSPSKFNQAQLEDLQVAEAIVAEARKDAYKTRLAGREITSTIIDEEAARCLNARRKTSEALEEDTAAEAQTLNAAGLERAIVIAIQEMQAAAKQKYMRREPVQLHNYFIGDRINPNEATLHQIAFTIADRLTPPTGSDLATALDKLPGITLAKINHLRELIDLAAAPLDSSSASSSSSSSSGPIVPEEAVADRAARDAMIRGINDRRMEIQFAADAEWPYTDPLNATARRAFHLPASRPYSG